jgi:mannan endo-1,4-beta-mannosidase
MIPTSVKSYVAVISSFSLAIACANKSAGVGSQVGGASGSATTGGTNSVSSGGTKSSTGGQPSTGVAGTSSVAGAATNAGLHVQGRNVLDGNGELVQFRGIEHVMRWNITDDAVDPGGSQIPEIAKTGANTIRILYPLPSELDGLLHKAIVEQKMWVSITHTTWDDPLTIAAVQKYKNYVTLHAQGEVAEATTTEWRDLSIAAIQKFRGLGYTVPLELLSNGYGQELDTIISEGETVFAADPLANVIFGIQMYSLLVSDIPGALAKVDAFPHPIWVGTCLFQEGIDNGYGNDPTSYKQVWEQTQAHKLSSLYWMWNGDDNSLSADGTFANLTDVGKFIIRTSSAALLTKSTKTAFLQAASVN